MSMLTMQIDELRKAARNIQGNLGRCCYRRKDIDEMHQVSDMLREAANTIESLRDRLQADVLGSGTCEMYRDEYGTWHCKSCESGADTDTGSDGTLDTWCDAWPPNYCPNCGRKVVS